MNNLRPAGLPSSWRSWLLPDAAVGSSRWSQVGLGVRAQRAPGILGAGLHDGAGGGAHGADVGRLPQLAHQAVQPLLQLGAGQGGVALGLLHVAQADGDVEHRVQAVEALLHVAVLGRPVVQLQGVVCVGGGGWEGAREKREREREDAVSSSL